MLFQKKASLCFSPGSIVLNPKNSFTLPLPENPEKAPLTLFGLEASQDLHPTFFKVAEI